MINWVYFVLISEFIWAFTSLVDKVMLSKEYIKSPFVFIIFDGLANVLLVFMLPFFDFGHLSVADILISILGGLFLTLGLIFYYKAVQCEEISRVLILWQFIPIFVLLFSFLFLKELLTTKYLVGFLFLLIAGITVSYKKINGSFKLSKAFYYMIGSDILISIYYISSVHIYKITNFWSAFMWLKVGALSPVFLLFSPSVRNQFIITCKNMRQGIKGLMFFKLAAGFSGFIFLGLAMLNGPIALITALGSAAAPIFIFFITLFTTIYLPGVLKENISRKMILTKILAIAFAAIGIIFVNL